jgi:Mrp family chromosome partitioning ATPase
LVLVFVIAFAALGFATKFLQGGSGAWTGSAVLVVEDPRASALFDRTAVPQGRYVQNQVAILRSTPVAEKAAETLGAVLGSDISASEVLGASEVIASANSSEVISILFRSDSGESAVAGANAIADAYQFVRRTEAARNYQTSLERLDEFITNSDARLVELQQEIDGREVEAPFEGELQRQLNDAVRTLVELGDPRSGSLAELERTALELTTIQGEIEAVQRVLEFEPPSAELDAIRRERENLFTRIASLTQRRDEIEIDSELLGSGVLLSSLAVQATPPAKQDPSRNIILGTVFGLAIGALAAYFMALRRRTFSAATQPAVVLDAPLLAEVPHFKDERVSTLLPVVDAPNSVAAEAFRFIVAATQLRFEKSDVNGRAQSSGEPAVGAPGWIAFVSASPGDGKSVITANTALAAAGQGQRVLIVDADVGEQGLSQILVAPPHGEQTSVALPDGSTMPAEVVTGEHDGAIHLINRESLGTMDPMRFATEGLRMLAIAAQRGRYDLVCVDVPPLLHVAYANTIAGSIGSTVVVVPHGSRVSEAEEVWNLLALSHSKTLGFVYNKAPLRTDASAAGGSARSYRATLEPEEPPSRWDELVQSIPGFRGKPKAERSVGSAP